MTVGREGEEAEDTEDTEEFILSFVETEEFICLIALSRVQILSWGVGKSPVVMGVDVQLLWAKTSVVMG